MIAFFTGHRGRLLAILAAVITWTLLVVGEILPDINRVTPGFASYYGASYAVLHGGAADLDDNDRFPPWVVQSGIDGIHEIFGGNVPTLALLMIPLTAFPPATAQTIWLIVDVSLLALCAWLAGKAAAPHNPVARWWIAAAFPLLASVSEALRYGQVYLLMASLSLIAIRALQERQDIAAGVAVAGMLLIKPYYGVLCLGLLVWSRRPRSLVAASAVIVFVIIGSRSLLTDVWLGFPSALANANAEPWASVPVYQTINGLTQRLFQYTPAWNPNPLIDAPWLATVLRYGLTIILVVVTLWQARKHDPLWLWPPALALMPILSPLAEVYHYNLLMLPIAVGIARLVERKADLLTTGLIVAALLLLTASWWPSLHSQTGWDGWNGLLAYPRLVGGLLLWAALTLKHSVLISPRSEGEGLGVRVHGLPPNS